MALEVEIPAVITLNVVVGGFVLAVLLGVLSGLYPARNPSFQISVFNH